MLKKLVYINAFLLLALISVKAQVQTTPAETKPQDISAEKKALIQELVDLTNSKKTMDEVVAAIFDEIQKGIPRMVLETLSDSMKELTAVERQRMTDEITASMQKANQRFREAFNQRVDFAAIVNEISIPLYAKYFSEEELKDLISFYRSKTGQHAQELMPKLFAESIAKSEELLGPKLREIIRDISTDETDKFEKKIAEMVEAHHRTAKPQTKPKRSSKRP